MTGGEIKVVEFLAAKTDVAGPGARLGFANNPVDPSRLVADLHSYRRRHVEPAGPIHTQAVGTGPARIVRQMKMKIRLFVRKRAIRLKLETVDKLPDEIRNKKEALIGG